MFVEGVHLSTFIPTSIICNVQQSVQSITVILCTVIIAFTYRWETILISYYKQKQLTLRQWKVNVKSAFYAF